MSIMIPEYTKFYYHALSKKEKEIYLLFYEAFKTRKKNIMILANPNNFSIQDIAKISDYVCYDTPSFFYVDLSKYSYIKNPLGYIYCPNYWYDEQQTAEYEKKFEAFITLFQTKYITPQMTEFEKLKTIHDFLVKNIAYNHDAVQFPDAHTDAYTPVGVFLHKYAVCMGISTAYKMMCDFCKLKCLVITGDCIPQQGDAGHAWNIVKINDQTYHVDCTWDLKDKGDISFCYDYLNLDDKLMSLDHKWDRKLFPPCTAIEENYYYKHKLYVKDIKGLSDYIVERLRQKENYIVVKFANTLPPENEILSAIRNSIGKFHNNIKFCYYISTKTYNIYIEIL